MKPQPIKTMARLNTKFTHNRRLCPTRRERRPKRDQPGLKQKSFLRTTVFKCKNNQSSNVMKKINKQTDNPPEQSHLPLRWLPQGGFFYLMKCSCIKFNVIYFSGFGPESGFFSFFF
jgi:hypothetical protein